MSEKYTDFLNRTDLACERHRASTDATGVKFEQKPCGSFETERLEVTEEANSEEIGILPGKYITVNLEPIWTLDEIRTEELSELLSDILLELCGKHISGNDTILVAGLGNRYITADAVGPETVDKIIATRHLCRHEPELFKSMLCKSIAVISPGVLAQTGIESADIIESAVKTCKAKLVIAIDALAARSTERLATTLQICDSGIVPGSGIGNSRSAINSETVGVPVIAIGIPTVVNSATLIHDAMSKAGVNLSKNQELISRQIQNFFVSPKESDTVTEAFSSLIADSVNLAFGVYSGS